MLLVTCGRPGGDDPGEGNGKTLLCLSVCIVGMGERLHSKVFGEAQNKLCPAVGFGSDTSFHGWKRGETEADTPACFWRVPPEGCLSQTLLERLRPYTADGAGFAFVSSHGEQLPYFPCSMTVSDGCGERRAVKTPGGECRACVAPAHSSSCTLPAGLEL